jgi:hypothetical protein
VRQGEERWVLVTNERVALFGLFSSIAGISDVSRSVRAKLDRFPIAWHGIGSGEP